MEQLIKRIKRLCRAYQDRCVEVEQREECEKIRQELKKLSSEVRSKQDIVEPEVLMAVMDAYEVTRDEGMLQEVLDVVSGNLERLEISVEGVKLLAYCYYYVEEEECRGKAGEMLEELRRRGKDGEELAEAEYLLQEIKDL